MSRILELLANRLPAETPARAASYLYDHYRAYRRGRYGATEALALALRQPLKFIPSLDPESGQHGIGKPWVSGNTALRFIEKPEALGLRFAGHADEIAKRRVEHTGWFNRADDDSSTLRGGVWRLPHGRLVPGYTESDNDGVCLAFGEVVREVGGSDDSDDALQDCASRADSIAAYEAEDERDHDREYQAGAGAARAVMEANEGRAEALQLVAEIKQARKAGLSLPAICATLQKALEAKLEVIADAREKRLSRWGDVPGYLEDDFRTGYCDVSGIDEWNAFARTLGLKRFAGELGDGLLQKPRN